jgi:hypothetical protein
MIQTGMQITIEIRDATVDDAPPISALRLGFRFVGQVQEANGVRFQPMELAAQALEPRTPSSSS